MYAWWSGEFESGTVCVRVLRGFKFTKRWLEEELARGERLLTASI